MHTRVNVRAVVQIHIRLLLLTIPPNIDDHFASKARGRKLVRVMLCSTNQSATSMPEATPALVVTGRSVTKSRSRSTRARGKRRCSSSSLFQCVIQERRSNKPASPKTNAPVQMAHARAPESTALRSHRLNRAGETRRKSWPGTMIRSPAPTSFRSSGNAATESNCAVSICRKVAESEIW